jgi:ubiquinone/menaquinone biosynthesis C-methylase UbiE
VSEADRQAKQAVVDVWTASPCGSGGAGGELGTRRNLESLLEHSESYAPWASETLGRADAPGLDLLDVGCGPGLELVRFASAGARVTGVDLVAAHVEQARRNLEAMSLSGTVAIGDAERLNLEDRIFDRVISFNALQFTPSMERALGEIHRVLRPGGDARVVVYHRDSVYFWLHFFLRRGILAGDLIRYRSMSEVVSRNLPWTTSNALPMVRVQSRRGLKKQMERAGFTEVSTSVRGFFPDHSSLTAIVARRLPSLRDGATAERLGRVAGWYIAARGTRPPTPAQT